MSAVAHLADRAQQAVPAVSELVGTARAGDERALEELIKMYQRRVAAMVISLTGHDDDWQDICQEAFVKMVLALRRLSDVSAFEPWLFRIVRNCCFDHLRRRRTRSFQVPWQSWHDSIPNVPAEPSESRSAALEAGIQQLPSDQRDLMTMARERSWSYQRLARASGASIGAIKSRLHRARRRLREIMTEGES